MPPQASSAGRGQDAAQGFFGDLRPAVSYTGTHRFREEVFEGFFPACLDLVQEKPGALSAELFQSKDYDTDKIPTVELLCPVMVLL